MDCDGIRGQSYEYLRGQLGLEEERDTKAHLRDCPACQADLESTRTCLAPLQDLPEYELTPLTWKTIETRLPRRPSAFSGSIRVAAAASLLVAIASFAVILSLPDSQPPVVADSGEIIPYGESYRAETFTTLTLPGVGSLRLNRETVLRFIDVRTVELESGEIFAEIQPGGRGFEIRGDGTTARVHGTRFGFTAPSTVYVVEGLVEVRTDGGSLELRADQASVGSRLLQEVTLADYLDWLGDHQRPDVRLILDPKDNTTITPGAPLTWHIRLETNSIAPIFLGDLDDLSQFLFLKVDDTQVSLDPNRARVHASRLKGRVRLDEAHPVKIEIAVDPKLFQGKGPASVRAVFTSGTNAPQGAWVGIVQSPPVKVEVR